MNLDSITFDSFLGFIRKKDNLLLTVSFCSAEKKTE